MTQDVFEEDWYAELTQDDDLLDAIDAATRCRCSFCTSGDLVFEDGLCEFCFVHCPPRQHPRFAESIANVLRWRAHLSQAGLEELGFNAVRTLRSMLMRPTPRSPVVTLWNGDEHDGEWDEARGMVRLAERGFLHGPWWVQLEQVARVRGDRELALDLEEQELDRRFLRAVRAADDE